MTDASLFNLILEYLRITDLRPGDAPADPALVHRFRDVITTEIALRGEWYDVGQHVIRVTQAMPFAVGTCGQDADARVVQTSLHLVAGDALVHRRRR